MDKFANEISRHVWQTKYRYADHATRERSIADTWRRVARALAAVEPKDSETWEERFFGILQDFKFLPGGRIQAGAGTARNVTLFNCFVMGTIEDSIPGIFSALQEGAVTMQQGGGIGMDFSTLRPRGTPGQSGRQHRVRPRVIHADLGRDVRHHPVDRRPPRRHDGNAALRSSRHRRIHYGQAAARAIAPLQLVGPGDRRVHGGSAQRCRMAAGISRPQRSMVAVETVLREWPGRSRSVPCRVMRRIRARQLWDLHSARRLTTTPSPACCSSTASIKLNNLWYRERITATNPCGEIPLPPYGACDLGSLNLTRFVPVAIHAGSAHRLSSVLAETARIAVRMLDNVIDASRFPLPQQAENARGSRRIGLGITGLADALGHAGADATAAISSLAVAAETMRCICHAAYRASIALGEGKGELSLFRAGQISARRLHPQPAR